MKMEPITENAMAAVSAALDVATFNEELHQSSSLEDELLIELTWLKWFLIDGQRTPEGRQRAEIWSPAIERLAQRAVTIQSGWVHVSSNPFGMADLLTNLSYLRDKLQLCVTSASSPAPKDPELPISSLKIPKQIKENIKVAAWGGPGGKRWNFKFDGTLKQITVANGEVIDSLHFTSLKSDGSLKTLKIGGCGGYRTSQINIDGTVEKLTQISRTYGFYTHYVVIRSITFRTTLTTYGPYGSSSGAPFSSAMHKGGKIVGLHGRAGQFVDAVGVFYRL
ncbi:unnamed protein product [Cuscuta epithymum]|uniref:Jacalin-type lectin domain-containing protein n=2 Tax=Cuscuta epithymum TaxID=186058 RepID=A0AAV0F696_9ASTE|nr:unnamed protein product [Cuscuta epithymum]